MKTLKKRSYEIVDIERQAERFVVMAEFYDGKTKVGEINQGFSLGLTEMELEKEVKKASVTFFDDSDRAVKNKVRDERDNKADQVIKKLKGKGGVI